MRLRSSHEYALQMVMARLWQQHSGNSVDRVAAMQMLNRERRVLEQLTLVISYLARRPCRGIIAARGFARIPREFALKDLTTVA